MFKLSLFYFELKEVFTVNYGSVWPSWQQIEEPLNLSISDLLSGLITGVDCFSYLTLKCLVHPGRLSFHSTSKVVHVIWYVNDSVRHITNWNSHIDQLQIVLFESLACFRGVT